MQLIIILIKIISISAQSALTLRPIVVGSARHPLQCNHGAKHMAYIINAHLDQGTQTLTILDAKTGEKRLHWRHENSEDNRLAMQNLFKQLMLLSCMGQTSLLQRASSEQFGEECLNCSACYDRLED